MYSPKIKDDLIPVLYQIALSENIPMTRLVNRIIEDYLDKHPGFRKEEAEPGQPVCKGKYSYPASCDQGLVIRS